MNLIAAGNWLLIKNGSLNAYILLLGIIKMIFLFNIAMHKYIIIWFSFSINYIKSSNIRGRIKVSEKEEICILGTSFRKISTVIHLQLLQKCSVIYLPDTIFGLLEISFYKDWKVYGNVKRLENRKHYEKEVITLNNEQEVNNKYFFEIPF